MRCRARPVQERTTARARAPRCRRQHARLRSLLLRGCRAAPWQARGRPLQSGLASSSAVLYQQHTPGSPAAARARRISVGRRSPCSPRRFRRELADWLPLAISVFVVLLSWYGYRAMLEWRRELRDARGTPLAGKRRPAAQGDRAGHASGPGVGADVPRMGTERQSTDLYEINNLVASVFARYPYPESFFTWGAELDNSELIFFNRSDRRPSWMGMTRGDPLSRRHRRAPDVSGVILAGIRKDARRQSRLSAFHIVLGAFRTKSSRS